MHVCMRACVYVRACVSTWFAHARDRNRRPIMADHFSTKTKGKHKDRGERGGGGGMNR